MSLIIQPKNDFVNSGLGTAILSEKEAKLQEKLSAELLEIYQNINIVFLGTPQFSVPILEALCASDFKPKAVVTAPDMPVGREQKLAPPPVKIIAQKYQIPIFQPVTKEDLANQILQLKPDLIVTAAYGKILPKQILDVPKYGSINIHPSLLPKYRGPSPIQAAILNGDEETGTTIMLMNEHMDEGSILAQEIIPIEKNETSQTLSEKLSIISSVLLIKTLNQWVILKELPKSAQHLIYPQEQDDSLATYTKIITKQDGKIIWDKNASEIERQIRAFIPWPGSFTFLKLTEQKPLNLKILKAEVSDIQTEKGLGEIFITSSQRIAVQTGQGCLIINALQLEGGKSLSANDFINGHPEFIGKILQ